METDKKCYDPQKELVLEFTWDIARICPNGHVLTAHLIQESDPGMHCIKCGEKGLENCPNCSTSIRGLPYNLFGSFKPKQYCHECGKLYPWANRLSIIETVLTKLLDRASLLYWFNSIRNKSLVTGHKLLRLLNSRWAREQRLTVPLE